MEGLIILAKKKEESTNEKIVRLYKEGYSFDEISRSMNNIPKANVIGIVEKYFPEYKSYVQPKVDHSISEENEKGQKAKFPGVPFLKRNPKNDDHPVKITVNLDMDDEGFLDKHTEGIAKMLKDGRNVNDIAEFFNKDKADILAVRDVMDEHFRRVEARKKEEPAPAKSTETEDNKFSNFATGLETDQIAKPVRPKYTPPTYSKRDDPKPVSASYGLVNNDPVAEEKPIEDPAVEEIAAENTAAETSSDIIDEAELLRKVVEEANLPPVIEKEEVEEHKVSLLPDDDSNVNGEAAEDHKVSLIDDVPEEPAMDEILEIPSIESVSEEELEKELTKAPEPVEDIPEIGYENENITEEKVSTEVKEVYPGMSALEKMKQFAQEQIAANNKKIEELKSKKTDAENDAFDCNTKVEMMKKEIEEMQAKLLVLIDEKDKAGKVVSDINEEIEAINKENADYGTYL
jgi:hypothetical protein